MQRRKFTSGVVVRSGCWAVVGQRCRAGRAGAVTESDAALRHPGGARARRACPRSQLLGRTDGFLGNPKVRIPLPGFLNDAAKLLKLDRPAAAASTSW